MFKKTKIMPAGLDALNEAVTILQKGGLVAFPTETVYGLAANAQDRKAIKKVFKAKGRDEKKPLVIFPPDIKTATEVAKFTPLARKLADAYWPGALTLVLDKMAEFPISPKVTGGFKTIGLRMPDHKLARDLVTMTGLPLAVTSANISGCKSPTSADEISLKVDLIIDGGPCSVGVESTVLDARSKTPVYFREGALSRAEIEATLGL